MRGSGGGGAVVCVVMVVVVYEDDKRGGEGGFGDCGGDDGDSGTGGCDGGGGGGGCNIVWSAVVRVFTVSVLFCFFCCPSPRLGLVLLAWRSLSGASVFLFLPLSGPHPL